MGTNRVIGLGNKLPWHMPADLKRFKAVTMGKPLIMGRKTWESIGRPLPGRRNIVVTRDASYRAEGAEIVYSLDEAIDLTRPVEEIFVIGGADLFAQALPRADRLYLTIIEHAFQGTVYFPPVDPLQWRETSHEEHDSDPQNLYPYRFVVMER
jgi:dihydrofolate reductase